MCDSYHVTFPHQWIFLFIKKGISACTIWRIMNSNPPFLEDRVLVYFFSTFKLFLKRKLPHSDYHLWLQFHWPIECWILVFDWWAPPLDVGANFLGSLLSFHLKVVLPAHTPVWSMIWWPVRSMLYLRMFLVYTVIVMTGSIPHNIVFFDSSHTFTLKVLFPPSKWCSGRMVGPQPTGVMQV